MGDKTRARGFTLIELMLVLCVSSILATTFASVMYYQIVAYMQRLDEADAHQMARGAFNVLRHSIQGARYGFGQDPNATGAVGVGQCAQDAGLGTQAACTAIDPNGSDRLRLASMAPSHANFSGSSPWPSAGPCSASFVTPNPTQINLVAAAPGGAPTSNTYVIGGNCLDTNYAAATDVITISSTSSGPGNGCGYAASFARLDNGTNVLSCPTGYAPGFAYGMAQIRDFRVMPDAKDPNILNLTMRSTPYRRAPAASPDLVLAYNVSQFKVAYLIDYSTPTDHLADNLGRPCSDPRTVADGGTCPNVDSLGNILTTQQLYNRIVGVKITLSIRSAAPRANLVGPNVSNGYRTWTYTSLFSVRNNAS